MEVLFVISSFFSNIEITSMIQDTIIQILDGLKLSIHSFFPITLPLAVFMVNITLIIGAILYLLGYNEENGKRMIIRAGALTFLLYFLFNVLSFTELNEPIQGFKNFATFVTSYLLFLFAAFSLIFFIGNLGLYLISPTSAQKRILKKSLLCLLCCLIPLGLQFPDMPRWDF